MARREIPEHTRIVLENCREEMDPAAWSRVLTCSSKRQQLLGGFRDHPSAKTTMTADGRIARARAAPILLREHDCEHRVSAVGAIKGHIIPVRITENSMSSFIDATKVCYPRHALVPPNADESDDTFMCRFGSQP